MECSLVQKFIEVRPCLHIPETLECEMDYFSFSAEPNIIKFDDSSIVARHQVTRRSQC